MALQAASGNAEPTSYPKQAELPDSSERVPHILSDEALLDRQFQYWRGKSGHRYLHRVYSLLDCPALPKANFILVQRSAENGCLTLAVGQTVEPCGSANLASLRHQAALRGANEIHIHQLAQDADERDFIEQDLRGAQFEELISDLKSGAANGA